MGASSYSLGIRIDDRFSAKIIKKNGRNNHASIWRYYIKYFKKYFEMFHCLYLWQHND